MMKLINLESGVNVLDVSDVSHVLLVHRGTENEAAIREFLKRYAQPAASSSDCATEIPITSEIKKN